MLKLYNTLTRKIEEFKPINPPKVGMYSCGPTVYDFAHLGHFRSYIFVDTLKRVLAYNGFKVKQVMNLTDVGHLTEYDVEEQMRKRGQGKQTVWEIAEFYTQDFFQNMAKLNVIPADIVCKASKNIKEQIELIQKLEEKGYTYRIDDGVYFDIRKFPDYGKLGRLKLDGQEPGARVDINPQKRNPYDFALWKFSQPGEKRAMEWDSPWGKGVPGWHIECSAMAMKYLGDGEQSRTIDIHTGGEDLIPIHHTNEIAQAEAATGKLFVRYWLHNAHLIVEGKKMSRSKGNFYTLTDLEKQGFDPLALRYLFLTCHYRSKLNFTGQGLKGAQVTLAKLRETVGEWGGGKIGCAEYEEKFLKAINNDLDTPTALAIVWRLVKSDYPSSAKMASLSKFDQVLGLELSKIRIGEIPAEVKKLVQERENLRQQKNWLQADKIRKEIGKAGFVVEDTPGGPKIREKSQFNQLN